MKWWRAIFDNAKTHFIPDEIKDAILKNLADRKCRTAVGFAKELGGPLSEAKEIGLTLGMPCSTEDSHMEFDLEGTMLVVETREVGYFLDEIREAPERLDIADPYYKIHGKWHCVCLLPEHRKKLIKLMEAKLPEANAITELENQRFNEALAKIRKKTKVMITERPTVQIGEG